MRSSGRTTVSRTRVRIDSVRRRRRGRRVIAPAVVSLDGIVGIEVFIVIVVSVKESTRAAGGAEAPAHGAIGAVGAEVLSADGARFESGDLLGIAAHNALPLVVRGHGPKFLPRSPVEYNPAARSPRPRCPRRRTHPGGVAQMVRAGVS